MKKSTSGFTIVELLIVVVIIGILAAIVIVAYNGITTRATFTKLQSDLKSIDKALGIYHAKHGSYPVSPSSTWRYSCDYDITDFISELSEVTSSIPQAPCKHANPHNDTWVYRSNGTDFKLIHIRGDASLVSQVPEALQDGNTTRFDEQRSWGYWSPGAADW